MDIEALRAIADGDADKLAALARLRPEALDGLYGRMLDARLLYPGLQFRNADVATRDRMLAQLRDLDGLEVERSLELSHLLVALAWIGDTEVQRAFAAWRERPPSWRSALFVDPHAYAPTAGWSLRVDGTRRDLFLAIGVTLERVDVAAGPVVVLALGGEPCRYCSNPLGVLFELDLTAPELAFVARTGPTLKIPFCHMCSVYGPIFFRVEADGRTQWHERNERFPVYEDAFLAWHDHQFVLGRRLTNPYELVGWVEGDYGRIGGCPGWIQDAEYPACIDCGELMTFIGQVDVSSGGRFYGLTCDPCRVAVSVYQNT